MDINPNLETRSNWQICGHSYFGQEINPLLLVPDLRGPMLPWKEDPALEDPRLMRPWEGDRFGLVVGCEERPHNYTHQFQIRSYFSRYTRACAFGRIVFTGERFEYQGPGGANPPHTETDRFGSTRPISERWHALQSGQKLVLPFGCVNWSGTRPVHFADVEETPNKGILLRLKQVACFPILYGLFPSHKAANTTMNCRSCGELNWWHNCTEGVSIGSRSKWTNNLCRACSADLVPATWEEVVRTFAP